MNKSVHLAADQDQNQTHIRPVDPNVLQRRASDPQSCVWVNASAGSGKTKVLTDRVLRLLLPRADQTPGTPVHKILCITFTKAGASEMAERLQKTLSEWATADENSLDHALEKLLGQTANTAQKSAARQLFHDILDAPEGLKIMTIHSFCQSVLGRFPLESGLSPHFSVMDEGRAAELVLESYQSVLKTIQITPPDSQNKDEQSDLDLLTQIMNEDQFAALVKALLQERFQLQALLQRHPERTSLRKALSQSLGLAQDETPQSLRAQACATMDLNALRDAGKALLESSGKTDQAKGAAIIHFAHLPEEQRVQKSSFEDYTSIFIKTSGGSREIFKRLFTKAFAQNHPASATFLEQEAQRIYDIDNQIRTAEMVRTTLAVLTIGRHILCEYEHIKAQRGQLDYDDLILRVLNLLKNPEMSAWVMFKLDHGLDHILVDEAQDTNPEQWKIIQALCEEFFSGRASRDDTTRTIFVVGDEKQSIYSFQRAAPEEFHRMQHDFENKVKASNGQWSPINMDISFRSTEPVLHCVDQVFANSAVGKGVSENITHQSFRLGQSGQAVLWPVFEAEQDSQEDKGEQKRGLPLPDKITTQQSGIVRMADFIVGQIKSWLEEGEILPSRDRAVRPGDIMLLTTKRTALSEQLIKALRSHNIPVQGSDRMVLRDELAVQDLLSLIAFCLQPYDDYMLACTLKSPLIGLSEEELFDLAHAREGSLWHSLQNSGKQKTVSAYLAGVLERAKHQSPYDFLHSLLHQPCPADRHSGLRAFQARLGFDSADILDVTLEQAAQYERSHVSNLQGFAAWMTQNPADIKKDQSQDSNQVRIMTVHGAKGLQAPIVILPDTMRMVRGGAAGIEKRLLWPQKTGLDVPLFSPRKAQDPDIFRRLTQMLEAREDEEYRRLLYVAMTRAEDRLYVSGAVGQKRPLEQSWYFMIKEGVERTKRCQEDETSGHKILTITNAQTRQPDRADTNQDETRTMAKLPEWLLKPAPAEPNPPVILRPSQDGQTALSTFRDPLSLWNEETQEREESSSLNPLQRGVLVHKLLQVLPDIDAPRREEIALRFIEQTQDETLHPALRKTVQALCALLDHSDYKAFFEGQSYAEAPVSGVIDGQIISGQIDRLVIRDDHIYILDYKTGQPPENGSVPEGYVRQMHLYRQLVAKIYPERKISCGLLWTDGPSFTLIP